MDNSSGDGGKSGAPVPTSEGHSWPQPHGYRGCSPVPLQSWLHLSPSLPCLSSHLMKPPLPDSVLAEQEHCGPWPGLLLVTMMTKRVGMGRGAAASLPC